MKQIHPKYPSTKEDKVFERDIMAAADRYFRTISPISQYGDRRLYLKSIIFISLVPILYLWILFYPPPQAWVTVLLCGLMGIVFASIGFNAMHDASHNAYSSKPWVNTLMGHSLSIMGCSIKLWETKHVVLHHTFVNTAWDEDIQIYPAVRTMRDQQKKWFHRYQHWYAIPIYALLYFGWVFIFDFKKYFKGEVHGKKVIFTQKDHVWFWISKIGYFLAFVCVPVYKFGFSNWLIGYSTLCIVCGVVIALVFQLAHVVESSTFPELNMITKRFDAPWAVSQVQETSDFAVDSKVISWLFGGLNFQTIHHLLPQVSHVHYPALSPIIERVCKIHNLTYNKISFCGAIASHFRTLKRLGNMP